MTTVDRQDISRLQEDLGPKVDDLVPCRGCGKPKAPGEFCPDYSCSGSYAKRTKEDISIKPPQGVPMNLAPIATGAPANEVQIVTPIVVIRFTRGKCIVEDPIGTIVALDDAAMPKPGSSAAEIASLLRTALTSTTTIEFDGKHDANEPDEKLTFTETRAISDAIVKWSVELGKP